MAKKKTYTIKGICTYSMSADFNSFQLSHSKETFDEIADRLVFEGRIKPRQKASFKKACQTKFETSKLMSGKTFLKKVQKGELTNAKGTAIQVFVDGYLSNLSLNSANYRGNGFLADESLWKYICDDAKVEVNWIDIPACDIFTY